MSNLHTKILKNNSAFRHMAVAAYVAGTGGVICIIADLYWLFGDMSIQVHPHHYVVLTGLVIALTAIIASYIWIYIAVNKYLSRHEHIHTKHERLVGEMRSLRAQLKRIEFHVNINRADTLAGLTHDRRGK